MDISKPDFKAILGKMSFLRNHLNMLVPIIIAIVSIVPFVLAGMVGSKLDEQVSSKSLSQGRTLASLANGAVSERQWEAVRDAMERYVADANQIEFITRQSSLRPLLSTKIFPAPEGSSQLLFDEFAKNYLDGIERMVTDLDGRDCPSEAEMEEHTGGNSSTMGGGYGAGMEAYGGMEGYGGMEAYGGQSDMMGYGSGQKIVDAICTERAMSSRVYVSPEKIAGYNFWNDWAFENQDYALEDCWYWQMGYWIVEDVLDTLRECNEGSGSIFTSPVKRLKEIRFARVPEGGGMGGMAGYGTDYMMGESMGSDAEDKYPKLVLEKTDAICKPLTLRLSTETEDIVHFGMAVVVDARKVLWFMKKLCTEKEHVFAGFSGTEPEQRLRRNQITILESSMKSFTRKLGPHRLYRYGEDPVVELNLVCEYVFDLEAYKAIIPDVVTANLAAEEEN